MSQPIWLGVGGEKPQPRVLKSSMFGHVVDAFDEKTITKIGEVTPYERRMRAMKEAEKLKEERDGEVGGKGNAAENATSGASNNHNGGVSKAQNGGAEEKICEIIGPIKKDLVCNKEDGRSEVKGKSNSAQTLVKGGRVVNDDCSIRADVLIDNGKIVEISERIEERENMKVVDASNKFILPGGIDLNTSFGCAPFKGLIQSVDDFQTGTKAALLGGTTLIAHNLEPDQDQSYVSAFEELISSLGPANGEARKENGGGANDVEGRVGGANDGVGGANGEVGGANGVHCDYVVRVGLTWWSEIVGSQLQVLVEEKGTTLFYIPSDLHYSDCILVDICKLLKKLGVVLVVTPSDPLTTHLLAKDLEAQKILGPEGCYYSCPEEVELLCIHRYVTIAGQLHLPIYISSISSHSAAQLVAKKRRDGNVIFSEVVLPSIALDGSKVLDSDWLTAAHHVTHPPIRMHENNARLLLNQLANNDIQLLSSQHSSFSTACKAVGRERFSLIPPGVAAVQERIEVLWSLAVGSGVMDACRLVACTSSLAAKLVNLYPRKGRVAIGSDADLIIFDPAKEHEYRKDNRISKIDFNVWEGMVVKGAVSSVFKDGRLVVSEGALQGDVGGGRLIKCAAHSDVAFSRTTALDQASKERKGVVREPYDGPISGNPCNSSNQKPSYPAGQRSENFCRPPTRSGGRNMQDTTLFISVEGTYADDPIKCQKLGGYRVNQPPGGRTTQFW